MELDIVTVVKVMNSVDGFIAVHVRIWILDIIVLSVHN